jgi:hypothetical protein
MNLGAYFVDAGAIIQMFFKSPQMQQVGQFLTTLGLALEGGQGQVGPIRLGNDNITVTISPIG